MCGYNFFKMARKEITIMNNQDDLRQKVKLAKAMNDEWSYKLMSEVIQINKYSFYNWLNGAYQLSPSKYNDLMNLVYDLLPEL